MIGKLEKFKTMFLDECEEHVRTLEKSLTALKNGARGQDWVDNAFRAVHSVKGGAGMLGFSRIVPFAHTLEAVLDAARLKRIPITDQLASAALRAVDCLSDLVIAAGKGVDLPSGFESSQSAALVNVAGISITTSNVAAMPDASSNADDPQGEKLQISRMLDISFRPHVGLLRRANDPLFILRQLAEMGAVKVSADCSGLPPLADMNPTDAYLSWNLTLQTKAAEQAIRSVFEFVEDDCALSIAPAAGAEIQAVTAIAEPAIANGGPDYVLSEPVLSTIRVDLDRIDRLVNLSGEIAISQALVAQLIDQSLFNAHPRLFQELSQLLTHTQNLQDSVMAIRAQPIRTIFERMPRLVRELCDVTGKSIVLRLVGEATEIDKTMIEQLSDPIMHMIRNAADHGIENSEERIARGKPADGIITLRAEQRGSRIVIEIEDDGRGIDREKVRQRALECNLVSADENLGAEEIDHLIFLPGFTTAERVSDISGRGVGMDVVKRNIQRLGGRIAIRSELGRGTRMTLTLPLTLAVLEGMVVRSGGESYVIPIGSIVECRNSWSKDSDALPGLGEVLNVRGTNLRLLHLSRIFNIGGAETDSQSIAVIAEIEGGHQIALVVDEIVGQQQVVIKSLADNFEAVPGVAGATILGDGRVALILDPTEIARLASGRGASVRQSMDFGNQTRRNVA